MKVRTNGIETHYTVEGEGPWLTMSHSLACNLSMWDEQAALLARRFSVLRYDTRGHGESGAPLGPYTLEQLADDAKALFDALGIEQTHWVGLSMGGMIGQVFALKYPGVFQSMVLADTTSRRPPNAAQMWGERVALAREKGMDGVVEGTLARWFTEAYRSERQDVMDRISSDIRRTPVEGFAGCCAAIAKVDVLERLHEIRCPTLVIVGEEDRGTPVDAARKIQESIAGAELVIIPSAAHLSNVEQAQAFNGALMSFYERLL
ncbi:MAG TPA: 3-oxoadipate enol-lactonase [Burkholderiales bacterium]|nr:3-oxoadipate enol-lactonase [Burkholderiales bacterium]